ncbi:MAG: hypothetical protein CME24_02395 [Gemmatimonadetes bacterium]|nr:hypothetical protein [Gemmatimonadota bacterium]
MDPTAHRLHSPTHDRLGTVRRHHRYRCPSRPRRGGHRSLPSFTLVGLPDSAVRESRERVMASIRNAGFQWPRRRVTVSLAPADLRKERSAFDLAIAIGVLVASEQIRAETLADFALLVPAIDALSVNSRPHDAAKEFLLRHVDLEPLAASRAFVKKAESHGPLLT